MVKRKMLILSLLMRRRSLEVENFPISKLSREDSRQKSCKRRSSIWILLKIRLLSLLTLILRVKNKIKKMRLALNNQPLQLMLQQLLNKVNPLRLPSHKRRSKNQKSSNKKNSLKHYLNS